jgi:hypothetical protein
MVARRLKSPAAGYGLASLCFVWCSILVWQAQGYSLSIYILYAAVALGRMLLPIAAIEPLKSPVATGILATAVLCVIPTALLLLIQLYGRGRISRG